MPARAMSRRPLSILGRALFLFYCTAVGVYLVLRPWSSDLGNSELTASGFFRGFVSGLGLLHLVAGVADLRAFSRELGSEEPPP